MYITQRSVFLYTLRITPHGLRHNEFARKDGQRERQYSSPGLREKLLREAMNSTLCKLSMIIHIPKAACNKHPWVWFNMKYFWPSTKEPHEMAIHSCEFTT